MKAFLSTNAKRHVPPFPDSPCPPCQDEARAEARIILSYAEPIDTAYRLRHHAIRLASCRAALAEALAAFITE